MNTGRSIRILRAARGLQQQDLATLARLDASYVSLLESGKRKATPEALTALARALGVSTAILELLGADSSELRGIRPAQAKELGLALASALAQEEPT